MAVRKPLVIVAGEITQLPTGDTITGASGGGLTLTSVKTADYTAAAGELVRVDANGASGDVTVQLPASPSDGDQVGVVLSTDHATRIADIDRNGNTINGLTTTTNLNLVLEGDSIIFTYVGGGTGWRAEKSFQAHYAQMVRAAAQSISPLNARVKIAHDTAVSDTGGIADLTNDWVLTRRAGKYLVSIALGREDASIGSGDYLGCYLRAFTGGSSTITDEVALDFASFATGMILVFNPNISIVLDLAAGTKLEMWVQSSEVVNTRTVTYQRPTLTVTELI